MSSTPFRDDRSINLLVGGIAGLASGLLGVGGGFLIVPLKVIWSQTEQRRATGTSLAAIFPIALVGTGAYYFGTGAAGVDLNVAFFLAVGGSCGAFAGSRLARRVPDHALKLIVAILLVLVGLKEVHDALFGVSPSLTGPPGAESLVLRYSLIAMGGLLIGILSGLTGVSGGIFLVPTMVLGFGISQRIAQGTSLLAILPTVAVGAIAHHRDGNVDVRAARWIALAGVPAALVGSAFALSLPERALHGLFGLFLLLAAIQMWPRGARLGVTADFRKNGSSEANPKI